jgi:hypothetical protein
MPAVGIAPREINSAQSKTTGLLASEDWRPLFSAYSTIVLVANSGNVDVNALRAKLPVDTLFVFFNKVFRVLERPFDGNSLLVARSGLAGADIVYRREVHNVVRFFNGDRFHGIMNLTGSSREKFSPASAFNGVPAGHLDLTDFFADFYPTEHVPSSGFALAAWLCNLKLEATIILAGFTAKRSEQWKLYHIHDWTYEQIVQRLLSRSGRLMICDAPNVADYAALTRRFPDISAVDIGLAAADVLSQRVEASNMEIDKLISLTRFGHFVDSFFRKLKPKTRKQKLVEMQARGDNRT